MRIRGHGNGIAIALAGLAVVIAATGTAYAVTATTVNIADKTTPANVAKVDSSGRLAVVGAITSAPTVSLPLSKINGRLYAFVDDPATPLTSPTTATLALTALGYDNAYNRLYSNTDYDVLLEKITVGASGTCTGSDVTTALYRTDALPQGQSVALTFPSPVMFGAVGGTKYCIGALLYSVDSSHSTPYSAVGLSFSAYSVSGTYTGTGIPTAATPDGVARPAVRR